MKKKIYWEHLERPGSEYLSIIDNSSNKIGEGLVLFTSNEELHKFAYKIDMDLGWVTKSIEIRDLENNDQLFLQSDGSGKWYSGDVELVDLDGAIDVDISITPFSNTLPINRFNWGEGEVRDFYMVYIDVPSLELKKIKQQYKFIGNSIEGKKFQYKCRDYETIITVDQSGIVEDYPDLFIRRF